MICDYCQKEYFPRFFNKSYQHHYCSTECMHIGHARNQMKRVECVCVGCGIAFMPKVAERNKFCSRECAFKHRGRNKPIVHRDAITYCQTCGKQLDNHMRKRCVECNKEKARIDMYKRNATSRACTVCGKAFIPEHKGGGYAQCCIEHKRIAQREQKKTSKTSRKAKKRGAYVAPVNYKEIYARDNGRCQLCGKKVDPVTRDIHKNCGTLDHIIPLALGGTHEPKNVQLAHFMCNSLKGTRAMGEQLRLC
jgi:5-methylcytosine-specific restriction endonuclease McrA